MKRIWVVAALAIVTAGCNKPAPKPEPLAPVPVVEPAPVLEPAPTLPDGVAPCRGPVTAGPPSLSISFSGVRMPLPMSDCGITLPTGPVELYLSISNLQEPAPIKVTGAPEGGWEGLGYKLTFDLNAGSTQRVTLDVGTFSAQNPLTYTFVGLPAVESLIASGPSRQGPWSPLQGDLIPTAHTWLRIEYPRPMLAGSPSIISEGRYAIPGQGLPGEWEGNRLQFVSMGERKPVLAVGQTADENGLQIFPLSAGMRYRGAPPELMRFHPVTGATQPVYQASTIPYQLHHGDSKVYWWDQRGTTAIDLATGKAEPVVIQVDNFADGSSISSPDGRLEAALSYPEGAPGHPTAEQSKPVTLTIREGERVLVKLSDELTTWGSYSCSRGTPALAWRPDGKALAFLDAPTLDRLVLKEVDLEGKVRTIAEWSEPGLGVAQTFANLNWAPSGAQIVAGPWLLHATNGVVRADNLPERTFWSPDSQYLLLHAPDHSFTSWGRMALLTAGGARQDLGHGQALGWTREGEALFVRWEVSKEIPPPGKGCP